MRIITIILSLLISLTISATNYYVATPANGGSDANPGTFASPWASWQHAFTSTSIQPGDTVFIRGGVYNTTVVTGLGLTPTRHGTVNNWIVYINYPGEIPIMDCGNITADDIVYTGLRNQGITITSINYIKLQGLTIRNVNQYFDRGYGVGINIRDGYVILENCVAHHIEGSGMRSTHGSEGGLHRLINCDAYNVCDSIAPIGNVGNGFVAASDYYGGGETYFINCRAWHCADQGFNLASNSYVEADGCWSFLNTETRSEGGGGGGMGFKMGWQNVASSDLRRVVKNCIAAYNDGYGFFTNENGSGSSGGVVRSNHYNNIAYHNGYVLPGYAWGFIIQNTSQTTEVQQWRNFSNNISYDNSIDVYNYPGVIYSGSNNSWDIPLTMTDADFASVDTTGMTAPRQADGSFPDNSFYNYFLKLSNESVFINEGIDVGLPYVGAAPDLGPFEWGTPYAETGTDIVGFSFTSQTGAATINSTNHTVAIEVAYTADVSNLTPTITLSYGATVIPLSGVARNFTNPVPYTVTAEDGVTFQEWTVTVTQEAEPEEPPVETTGSIVKFNGKIVKR